MSAAKEELGEMPNKTEEKVTDHVVTEQAVSDSAEELRSHAENEDKEPVLVEMSDQIEKELADHALAVQPIPEINIECRQPDPVFVEMPATIKQAVADHLSAIEKLHFRGCSKELNSFVNTAYVHYHTLLFTLCPNHIGFSLTLDEEFENDLSMEFHFRKRNCLVKNRREGCEQYTGRGAIPEAMEFFMKYIANPKTSYHNVEVSHLLHAHPDHRASAKKRTAFYEFLKESVKEMKHQIHVEEVSGHSRAIEILVPLTKPGTLEKIEISPVGSKPRLRQLVELDQWKQLKGIFSTLRTDLQWRHVRHIKEMDPFSMKTIDLAAILDMIDNVQRATELEPSYYSVYANRWDEDPLREYFDKYPHYNGRHHDENTTFYTLEESNVRVALRFEDEYLLTEVRKL